MTIEELRQRQQWSLTQKIDHSLGVIEQFYNKLNGGVYVAFSGGKDSTVLYWLARKIYPNIKAVFCNTRNEHPEIVKFVIDMKQKAGLNIDIITPKYKPHEVISMVGFPLVSKQTSELIYYYRNKPGTKRALKAKDNDTQKRARVANKYRYLFNEPYECSAKCCDLLKKKPMHEYGLANGLSPILGTMACESQMREYAYIVAGQCNTFDNRDKRKQKSRPLSIWTEMDIQECIKTYNIDVCEIYSKGIKRTGCVCCGMGVQMLGDMRLQYCFENYPKMYDYFMNMSNNGVKYRDVLRKLLLVHGRTLPDEQQTLF